MRKALLVGINKYPGSPLRGCVNDVITVFQILTSRFNFKTEEIKILTDHEATKRNMVEGLKWLTDGAQSGDTIVFHYSGHGSQVMVDDWTDTDEIDGRDEILCPVDLDWDDPLRDHEVGAYFKAVPKDCTTLVILDCCHSGTGLRNGFMPGIEHTDKDFINRFISPPVSNILRNSSVIIQEDFSFDFPDPKINTRAVKSNFLIDTTNQGDAVLLAGCEENQTSADAWINSQYRGAMTYALARTLLAHHFDITYKNLITEINVFMDKANYEQNPQLEADQIFFDKKFLK
ncbi:MAG: hypothetical protein DRI84_05530 [Bacteroidetes bacterium]|nr:MAG: hypothetical protein DRI84_05530 [Bacteroidota bacterium]